MSTTRLSFRPRPLDVNKKLAIVRSIKELDGEDGAVNRSVHHGHIALDADNEPVLPAQAKKGEAKEIPTPECQIVANYDVLYPKNFHQPLTYVRRRPARAETEAFVEYDLDDEDEEWLEGLSNSRSHLSPEKLETMLYHLELADARARFKALTAATSDPSLPQPPPFVLGVKVPVALQQGQATEALRPHCSRSNLITSVYEYWRQKREKLGKPILRRLQPPPAVTDTNPFNVFRPREKIHRPNTRRRRENDAASYEKLFQVRRSMEEAQKLLAVLQKREETKKELMDTEFALQQAAIKDSAVGKMYLDREAKRLRRQQQAAAAAAAGLDAPWSGTPAGIRLKVHLQPPPGEDGFDFRGSSTKQELLEQRGGLNGFHTPTVTTKKRSTPGMGAPGSGGSLSVKLRLPSPEPGRGLAGDDASRGASPVEIHQLQLHRKKRRRNTVPLRGAAAASAAAAANARSVNKLHGGPAGAPAGRHAASALKAVWALAEPPQVPDPTMWFASPGVMTLRMLAKRLQLGMSTEDEKLTGGAQTAAPAPTKLSARNAGDLPGAAPGISGVDSGDVRIPSGAVVPKAGEAKDEPGAQPQAAAAPAATKLADEKSALGVSGTAAHDRPGQAQEASAPASERGAGTADMEIDSQRIVQTQQPIAERTDLGTSPALAGPASEPTESFHTQIGRGSWRSFQSVRGRPRFGRGGRLMFDRWDVLKGESLPVSEDGTVGVGGQESSLARENSSAGTPSPPQALSDPVQPMTIRLPIRRLAPLAPWVPRAAGSLGLSREKTQANAAKGAEAGTGEGVQLGAAGTQGGEAGQAVQSSNKEDVEMVDAPTGIDGARDAWTGAGKGGEQPAASGDKAVAKGQQPLAQQIGKQQTAKENSSGEPTGDRKEIGPKPPRNGLHSTVGQQPVTA